jgi:8-hydroxy-5-deazaflavin:NADPH oxidoreductase
MSYAIAGFGEIGQALAHAFARKNIDVTVASRRPPEALAPQARAIGPTVVAKSLHGPLRPWFDKTWQPGEFTLVK